MTYSNKNIKNEIAFLSGKMEKGEYLKEDKVDSERFQMMVLSRVANIINDFLGSMEYVNRDFFEQQQNGIGGNAPCSPYGCSYDRYKDISIEERGKVKEMVYELLKDKVKLIDASIDKIFKGKEIEDDEEDEDEDEDEEESED